MKFKMMRELLVVVAMVPVMFLVACGKKDEGGSVAVTPTQYYTANNQCYQQGTSTVVSSSLCTNGYYQSGNVCYQNGTNTVVAITLCQNQGSYPVGGAYPVGQVPSGYIPGVGGNIGGNIGGGYMGGGQYCMGYFFSPMYGWGICNGTNCHNVMLYNQYGQPVYCP